MNLRWWHFCIALAVSLALADVAPRRVPFLQSGAAVAFGVTLLVFGLAPTFLFALVAMAFVWARMAKVALGALADETAEPGFYEAKLGIARFFMTKLLPENGALFAQIMAGGAPVMEFEEAAF